MNEKELITFCRYYKGEKDNPYKDANSRSFWELEKTWVDEMKKPGESDLLINTPDYINAGLLTWNDTDNTPYLLKVLLFNRFRHWLGGYGLKDDAIAFKKWYLEKYIGQNQ